MRIEISPYTEVLAKIIKDFTSRPRNLSTIEDGNKLASPCYFAEIALIAVS